MSQSFNHTQLSIIRLQGESVFEGWLNWFPRPPPPLNSNHFFVPIFSIFSRNAIPTGHHHCLLPKKRHGLDTWTSFANLPDISGNCFMARFAGVRISERNIHYIISKLGRISLKMYVDLMFSPSQYPFFLRPFLFGF